MSNRFPKDVREQAEVAAAAWGKISLTLTVGELTYPSLLAEIDNAAVIDREITNVQAILVEKVNRREATYSVLWNKVKRFRAAVKGIYGDDSSEYEMVGGTRISERKPPKRRTTTTA